MRPLSAFCYIKENKSRAALLILLFMCTVFLFIAGNYISSMRYFWSKNEEYDAKICLIGADSAAEGIQVYESYLAELKADENLIVQERSGRGFSGLDWKCTMGVEMGSASMVFNTPEDLQRAFAFLGIDCDLSEVGDRNVVMSTALAAQYGLQIGDNVDYSLDNDINGSYTLAALTEDNSYTVFYVVADDENLVRANVFSEQMSGQELRDYLLEKAAGRKVNVSGLLTDWLTEQFAASDYMFLLCILILSVIHAVTVNTVLTGHFIKRTYEFGIYRAFGITKGRIFRKCGSEILTMDAIGIVCGGGFAFLFTFLMNELYYIPKGQYLPYYSATGVAAFALSNLLVVIPSVIAKGRAMMRADVTEF